MLHERVTGIPVPVDSCCDTFRLLQGLHESQILEHGLLHCLGLVSLDTIKHSARCQGSLSFSRDVQQQHVPVMHAKSSLGYVVNLKE